MDQPIRPDEGTAPNASNEPPSNPFPESDPRHELWAKFAGEVPNRLRSAAGNAADANEQIQSALTALLKAPAQERQQVWEEIVPTMRSVRPRADWPDATPTDDNQLVGMLTETLDDQNSAVLRRLATLAREALEGFVAGKEDLGRYAKLLEYLVSSAIAFLRAPSPLFLDRMTREHEGWKETAAKYVEDAMLPPRRWNIEVSSDRERMQEWRTEYEDLCADLMTARGVRFDHPFQAADALLDLVQESLARMKSSYLSDWGIRPLCRATAKYCSAQRTLAVKSTKAEQAEFFGEFRRRCLELANECGESDENRKAGMYAYFRGIGAARNTDRPAAPSSTITAQRSKELARLDTILMSNGDPAAETSILIGNTEAQSSTNKDPVSQVKRRGRRQRRRDPGLGKLKARVRKLRDDGLSHQEICERLRDDLRPPRVGWRHLSWPVAYKKHTAAVTKWLSDACKLANDLPSFTN